MENVDYSDLIKYSDEELGALLLEMRKNQLRLRIQKAAGNLKEAHLPRVVRRQVAKIKTIMAGRSKASEGGVL